MLARLPGSEDVQIEVIDDRSTRDDPGAVVAECGQGRTLRHLVIENAMLGSFNLAEMLSEDGAAPVNGSLRSRLSRMRGRIMARQVAIACVLLHPPPSALGAGVSAS